MLASLVVVGLFVVVVVVVTTLARRGRLGDAARRLSFEVYGPRLAGAFAGGAAVVHVAAVANHVGRTTTEPAGNALALLCSIGAGAHLTGLDPAASAYAPLGIASVALVGPEV